MSFDITPGTELLRVMRLHPLGWEKALSELIDNSFDAGAKRVEIRVKDGRVVVSDDGNGCDDLVAMLRLGSHHEQESTVLGMHGVGLKDAAIWLWGTTTINTVKNGTLRTVVINWDRMLRSGKWQIEPPEERPAGDRPSGTEIVFDGIERKVQAFDDLKDKLSYTFSPAIKSGRQILIGRKSLEPLALFELPPLENAIEKECDLGAKSLRVRAGIVPNDETNPRPGFTIAFGHRVICATTGPCGNYSPTRFFAEVELIGDWSLSRNKDAAIDDDGELEKTLFTICEPVLIEADKRAQSIRLEGASDWLTGLFEGIWGVGLKEKRQSEGDETGTVQPSPTPRKRRAASVVQPGNERIRHLGGGRVEIEIVKLGEGKPIGVVQRDETTLIRLNQDHAAINEWHQKQPQMVSMIAAALLAHDVCVASDGKQLDLLVGDNPAERFGYLMARFAKHLHTKSVKAA